MNQEFRNNFQLSEVEAAAIVDQLVYSVCVDHRDMHHAKMDVIKHFKHRISREAGDLIAEKEYNSDKYYIKYSWSEGLDSPNMVTIPPKYKILLHVFILDIRKLEEAQAEKALSKTIHDIKGRT